MCAWVGEHFKNLDHFGSALAFIFCEALLYLRCMLVAIPVRDVWDIGPSLPSPPCTISLSISWDCEDSLSSPSVDFSFPDLLVQIVIGPWVFHCPHHTCSTRLETCVTSPFFPIKFVHCTGSAAGYELLPSAPNQICSFWQQSHWLSQPASPW